MPPETTRLLQGWAIYCETMDGLVRHTFGKKNLIGLNNKYCNKCTDVCHISTSYILSPQSSIHSGIDYPNCRMSLISIDRFRQHSTFFHDCNAIRLTEIYEFARLLQSNSEGCLPLLQAYKQLYAWWLVDYGYVNEARW